MLRGPMLRGPMLSDPPTDPWLLAPALSSLARRGSFAENNAHFGALAGAG